jgi:hypothetical protein
MLIEPHGFSDPRPLGSGQQSVSDSRRGMLQNRARKQADALQSRDQRKRPTVGFRSTREQAVS